MPEEKIKTERLFVSHTPYLAKPDAMVAFLRRAVGEILTEKVRK
jgi:hypothetical protein